MGLRQGITEAPPEEDLEAHPLFSKAAREELTAIEVSDVWRYLRAGIEAQREALLSGPLACERGETLEARWGAIQQLSLLLHGGPQLVLQYAQLAKKVDEPDKEGTYVAKAAMFEGE
jgi:hypothetical protein